MKPIVKDKNQLQHWKDESGNKHKFSEMSSEQLLIFGNKCRTRLEKAIHFRDVAIKNKEINESRIDTYDELLQKFIKHLEDKGIETSLSEYKEEQPINQ